MNNNSMKHFETIEGVPAQVVYHYTSLEALYSIVTNRSFRLTSLKSSNDVNELFESRKQEYIYMCVRGE